MRRIVAASLLLVSAALPAPALAAPPVNDQRAAAQPLALPAGVSGTTRDSTLELDEPSSCEALRGSVWYSIRPAAGRRIVARLAASGDLDAVVDVFQRTRSQLTPVECDVGNKRGQAEVSFRSPAKEPASYLVRVGQRANSVPGSFRLDVFVPAAAASPARAAASRPRRDPHGERHHQRQRRVLDRDARRHHVPDPPRAGARLHEARSSSPPARATSRTMRRSGRRAAAATSSSPPRPARAAGTRSSSTRSSGRRNDAALPPPGGAARARTTPRRACRSANYQRARGSLRGSGVDVVDLYRFSLADAEPAAA